MRRDNLDLFGEEFAAAAPARAQNRTENGEVENETAVTKCPSCGANMVYDSEKKKLHCIHCGTVRDIDAKSSEEQDFERLLAENNTWGRETHVFRCENCGAREVLDINEIAKTCPFCGTSNIVKTDELSGLKPNAVVPFQIGKDEAGSRVRKWIRKRAFAPGKFRKSARPEEIKGVYTPAFSFDTATESEYRAVLGKYYYTTRRVNGRTVSQRHIRYFTVSGHYSMAFDDVLVQASANIDQQSLDRLQPFDTNNSKEYTKEYLSGFTATQYSKSGLSCWDEAKGVIRNRLKSAILGQYTYDVVSSFDISTQCFHITYKYILLPVYVGHCNWHAKLYNFFVSGFNGKVTGKAPVSALKVSGLVLLGIGVLVGLYFLYRTFGG